MVLRGGNVTSPLHESRLLWIHDPHRSQTSPVPASHPPASQTTHPVPRINNTVPRINNTVPRSNNNPVSRNHENGPRNGPAPGPASQSSDVRVRAPLDNVSSSVRCNSSFSPRVTNCPPVPRNNATDRQTDTQKIMSPRPKKKRINYKRRERRARERREADEAFNHDERQANQSAGAPSSPIVPDQLTPLGLPHSDPISAMRPAVYPPVTLEGRPSANENSSFQFGQELGESAGLLLGLYKPAIPDPQHHTWAYTSAATSAKPGPPSPSRNLAASSAGDRSRTGIIYPLQPCSKRPDVCIEVEATLPEPAALLRPDLQQQLAREAPTGLSRPSRRHCRKRRRNRSTAIYRPAKRSPPRGHWCDI